MAKEIGANAIFSGTSESISYISDRFYGYSGLKQISTSFVTHLLYSTGKGYQKARFVLSGTIGEVI